MHLLYGAEVSKQTIATITDRVMDGMAEWQSRPLDPVYAVVFIDAIQVKVREGQIANRPVYLALGATVDGERDILGLWAGEHGDGAKFWLRVLTEIKNRGTCGNAGQFRVSGRYQTDATFAGKSANGCMGQWPLPVSGLRYLPTFPGGSGEGKNVLRG